MSRIHASLCCVVVAVAFVAGPAGSQTPGPITRTVYVTATNGKGAPITDLTARDFTVKEGGKDREVASAAPATIPMRLLILVDDNGRGFFQVAASQFIQQVWGHAEIAITTVNGPPTQLVDYTSDVEAMRAAIARLATRAGARGDGQVSEALMDASQDLLKRKAARPVIVVLTLGGGTSSVTADRVLGPLRTTGALMMVVGAGGGGRNDEELSNVLDQGTRQSGGRVEEFRTQESITQLLLDIGDELLHQYAVSYTLPTGTKPDERVNVAVTRKGVSLRVPSRLPVN